jgi:hypothetical protein
MTSETPLSHTVRQTIGGAVYGVSLILTFLF